MALNKVTYTDNVTVIGATNLNDIQDEIIANGESIADEASHRAYADLYKLDIDDTITNAQIDALFE